MERQLSGWRLGQFVVRDAQSGGIEEALAAIFRLPKLTGLWQPVLKDAKLLRHLVGNLMPACTWQPGHRIAHFGPGVA